MAVFICLRLKGQVADSQHRENKITSCSLLLISLTNFSYTIHVDGFEEQNDISELFSALRYLGLQHYTTLTRVAILGPYFETRYIPNY